MNLASEQFERNPFQRPHRAEGLGDVLELEERFQRITGTEKRGSAQPQPRWGWTFVGASIPRVAPPIPSQPLYVRADEFIAQNSGFVERCGPLLSRGGERSEPERDS